MDMATPDGERMTVTLQKLHFAGDIEQVDQNLVEITTFSLVFRAWGRKLLCVDRRDLPYFCHTTSSLYRYCAQCLHYDMHVA